MNSIKERCSWCQGDPLYEHYHDTEWGVPVYDDATLFEFLILETMQAGLSWITILKKRENYRQALDGFDPIKIAQYDQAKIESLMNNPGIIRHRLKIKSIISNAQAFLKIQEKHESFSKFLWAYVDGKPLRNTCAINQQMPTTTSISDQLAKDLKRQGFKFVGSTTIYAFMQAVGMVRDHETNCYLYDEN